MRSAFRLGLAFLLSASVCLGADQWTKVQSKNFTLVGNAGEKTIRQVGAKLEQFRAAFSLVTSASVTASSAPTVVIVFKDDKAFEPFKPVRDGTTTSVAGYFQGGDDLNYILLSPDSGGDNPYRVIFHEYVHQIIHTQSMDIPIWLNEGLAEYYSTFEVEPNSAKVRVGRVIPEHVLLLLKNSIPVSAILRASQDSFAGEETTRRGLFYAESWALTHYLLLGDDQRYRKGMEKYLSKVEAESENPEQDFVAAFGVNLAKIDGGLAAYIRQSSHPLQIFTLAHALNYEDEMTSAPMSESEVACYLGDALLHSRRMNEAESYLRRAISLDPNNADAHASFGILRIQQDRVPEAETELEKAVADPLVKPIAHYYYALALMREQTEEISQETNQKALTHLKKALELMPQYAPAYDLLAFVNLASDQEIDESIKLVQTGMRLAPKRMGFLLTLAQLQLRKRDYEGARKSLRLILSSKADETLKQAASRVLQRTDYQAEEDRVTEDERRRVEEEAARVKEQKTITEPYEPMTPLPPPGAEDIVSELPPCIPAFADLPGHRRMSGILEEMGGDSETLTFTLTTPRGRFVFLAPDRAAPVVYSCSETFDWLFNFTKFRYSAIVYFDAAPAGGRYTGRVVAVDIVSADPR